ncbi:hypothetical protein XF35_38010, partial [Streptomyces platensis subsp. clarensis]|nr:hypothetical protein [Streptomyces platensis subsp. clarensis]
MMIIQGFQDQTDHGRGIRQIGQDPLGSGLPQRVDGTAPGRHRDAWHAVLRCGLDVRGEVADHHGLVGEAGEPRVSPPRARSCEVLIKVVNDLGMAR